MAEEPPWDTLVRCYGIGYAKYTPWTHYPSVFCLGRRVPLHTAASTPKTLHEEPSQVRAPATREEPAAEGDDASLAERHSICFGVMDVSPQTCHCRGLGLDLVLQELPSEDKSSIDPERAAAATPLPEVYQEHYPGVVQEETHSSEQWDLDDEQTEHEGRRLAAFDAASVQKAAAAVPHSLYRVGCRSFHIASRIGSLVYTGILTHPKLFYDQTTERAHELIRRSGKVLHHSYRLMHQAFPWGSPPPPPHMPQS